MLSRDQAVGDGDDIPFRREVVDVGGAAVEQLFDPLNFALTLQFDLLDGSALSLRIGTDADPAEEATAARSILEAVSPGEGMTLAVDERRLPAGAEALRTMEAGQEYGANSSLEYVAVGHETPVTIHAVVDRVAGHEFSYMLDELIPRRLRGRAGYETTHVYPQDVGMPPTVEVFWEETPGLWVHISGEGYTADELDAIAGSLVPSPEVWETLQQRFSGS